MRIQATEYLDIDITAELWVCRKCGKELISARENYKKGCLVYNRDPSEIHSHLPELPLNSPDPNWVRYLEFYCPGCGTMIEVEPLPPGHPITYDIELDINELKKRARE